MAKFYALGNYTAQGFQGFVKDPKTDRSKAAQVAAEAVGAKLGSYTGLRGPMIFWRCLKELLHKLQELKWQQKLVVLFVISQYVKQLVSMMLQQMQQKLLVLIKDLDNNN